MMFGEIDSFFNLAEKLWKLIKYTKLDAAESIATRFVKLFEFHGVHRNQIPRFFDSSLSLLDVSTDEKLLTKLDNELIEKACSLFCVNRNWLDGVDSKTFPTHDFYKYPEKFTTFLDGLIEGGNEIYALLITPTQLSKSDMSVLVLSETIGYIENNRILRYHICHNWFFSYWKSRAYLTSCIAYCSLKDIFVDGKTADLKHIEKICNGELFDNKRKEIGARWYAEDLPTSPALFLKDIDPEDNNFGLMAALRLWLSLEDRGLMTSSTTSNYRDLFSTELAKLESK